MSTSLSLVGTDELDAYRCGYHNGLIDTFDVTEKYSGDARLRQELVDYVQDKEIELKNLTGKSHSGD